MLRILRRCNHTIKVNFVNKNKTLTVVSAKIGDSILQVAHKNNIELEGACEGVCACSTCHVYVDPSYQDSFPAPSEDEEDVSDHFILLEAIK